MTADMQDVPFESFDLPASARRVLLVGPAGADLSIDKVTGALNTVSYPHHEVHSGKAFWASYNAILGNGDVLTVSLTTPNTTSWSHLLIRVDTTAAAILDVLEDVTSFAGGGVNTIRNFNRNSPNNSGNSSLCGNTGANLVVPTGGTSIWLESLGARGVSTSRANASELILKQDSNYLFRVTNDVTTQNVTIRLNWYEHTSK